MGSDGISDISAGTGEGVGRMVNGTGHKATTHRAIYRQSDRLEKLLQICLIKHMPLHDMIDLSELLYSAILF